jgi:hypothetical protein
MGEVTSVTDSGVFYTLGVTPITYSSSVIPTTMFVSPIENIVMEFSQKGTSFTIADGESSTDLSVVIPNSMTQMVDTETPSFLNATFLFWSDFTIQINNPTTCVIQYQYYAGGAPVGSLRGTTFTTAGIYSFSLVEKIIIPELTPMTVSIYISGDGADVILLKSQSVQYIKIA